MESGVIRNGDQLEIEVIERIRIMPRSGGIIVSVSKIIIIILITIIIIIPGSGAGLGFAH